MKYEIKVIQSRFIDCNCYIIKYLDKTILIDPCIDVKTLKKYNIENINAILITQYNIFKTIN